MNLSTKEKVCFCTLALGSNYQELAGRLAGDLQKYSPETALVVLTDNPLRFDGLGNVLAFKHQQQSLGCYHDKKWVLAKALSIFPTCIFIDADMRIYAPLPDNLTWEPGITGHTVWHNIPKHNKNQSQIKLLGEMAHKLDINLEDTSFVHECLFVVSRDGGKEQEFLRIWGEIAPFFELKGYCAGEGHSIGLAAKKANLEIRQDNKLRELPFFKDKLVLSQLKKGEEISETLSNLIEEQRSLEYSRKTLPERIIKKLLKLILYGYRWLALSVKTLKNYRFYYK
ncbi:MAG: hypothetical protein N5P05_000579 [Chroococcopsis gigantea SAG 12.99]|jgi:hypothetical protein|nr:hypothetical protein [Chlorogloea purpurea SAG 13.99]MDV2998973.1 hypothetical protein [Chroococcopsis gigantea SAG 12.99]